MDYVNFEVGSDSAVMEVIRGADKRFEAFHSGCEAFRIKHGGTRVLATPTIAVSMEFRGDPPHGWRKRADGTAAPNTRTNAGKVIQAEMEAIPRGVHWANFCSMLARAIGLEFIHWDGSCAWWTAYEHLDGKIILNVPAPCGVHNLDGCRELLLTEYLRLRGRKFKGAA